MRNFINIINETGRSHAGQGQEIHFEQSRIKVAGLSLTLAAETVEIEGVELSENGVMELQQMLSAWQEDGYGSTVRKDALTPRDPDAEPRYGEPTDNQASIGSPNRREQ